MGQKSALGGALRAARKAKQLTQAEFASRAGVSVTALRTAEHGRGRWSTFGRLLAALGYELRGRSLMAGPVGPALAAARHTRGQSRRDIAQALQVSRNTLAALEEGKGLLAVLETYGAAIGAGLYLAATSDARAFYAHAGNSSAHHGWQIQVLAPRSLSSSLASEPEVTTTEQGYARGLEA